MRMFGEDDDDNEKSAADFGKDHDFSTSKEYP